MKLPHIVLASGSPRRIELIQYISGSAEILPSNIDETILKEIQNTEVPAYLALKKAKDVAKTRENALVIGCDTCVLINDEILGKPKDKDDAIRMLKALSGKTHKVITGCALILNNEIKVFSEETSVTFYKLSQKEIENYISTCEYIDKAGAYAIQGHGMMFVEKISGDYQNIVGLPVSRLKREIDFFLHNKKSTVSF